LGGPFPHLKFWGTVHQCPPKSPPMTLRITKLYPYFRERERMSIRAGKNLGLSKKLVVFLGFLSTHSCTWHTRHKNCHFSGFVKMGLDSPCVYKCPCLYKCPGVSKCPGEYKCPGVYKCPVNTITFDRLSSVIVTGPSLLMLTVMYAPNWPSARTRNRNHSSNRDILFSSRIVVLSFIPDISVAPLLQVHYTEAPMTTALILCLS